MVRDRHAPDGGRHLARQHSRERPARRLQGAQRSQQLADLPLPDRFVYVPPEFPRGDPFNVGQMYALFAEAVRSGRSTLPTFETALELHRLLGTIKQSSDSGRELPVAGTAG
jgi:predicted dehydrogenase